MRASIPRSPSWSWRMTAGVRGLSEMAAPHCMDTNLHPFRLSSIRRSFSNPAFINVPSSMKRSKRNRPFCSNESVQHSDRISREMLETTNPWTETLILRDFIHESLYNSSFGYFQKRDVVASVSASDSEYSVGKGLDFNDMLGETEYRWKVQDLYQQHEEGWLTPSELFHPCYVSELLRATSPSGSKPRLQVVEVGGGRGVFAAGFLDYFQHDLPHLYPHIQYTLVEVSARLSAAQRSNVAAVHDKATVVNEDAVTWLHSRPADDDAAPADLTVVIAMEVLDNMPHDKVVRGAGGELQEAVVRVEGGRGGAGAAGLKLTEELRPLQDPLITRYLQAAGLAEDLEATGGGGWAGRALQRLGLKSQLRYVPSTALRFVEGVRARFPGAALIASDFNALPDALPGLNAPVVQEKREGQSRFLKSYLSHIGAADIFFPTDFAALHRVWCANGGGHAGVVSHAEFCMRYGEVPRTSCVNGYNPLLQDYANVDMFLSAWPPPQAASRSGTDTTGAS